jgi:hypothetical protein
MSAGARMYHTHFQPRRKRPAEPGQASLPLTPSSLSAGAVRRCRVCGCTDDDCSDCVRRTGEPCRWVALDLCSACDPLS